MTTPLKNKIYILKTKDKFKIFFKITRKAIKEMQTFIECENKLTTEQYKKRVLNRNLLIK